jgi:Arc/MetJ-type ribon-helix-helix transcriptional regulator
MTITLPREQQEWLEAQVKAGHYDSVDQAVASIVGERMWLGIDDLSWAKPLVDEALASLERGEGLTLDEHRKRMEERFGKLDR